MAHGAKLGLRAVAELGVAASAARPPNEEASLSAISVVIWAATVKLLLPERARGDGNDA